MDFLMEERSKQREGRCKGPEAEVCLVWKQESKEASVSSRLDMQEREKQGVWKVTGAEHGLW